MTWDRAALARVAEAEIDGLRAAAEYLEVASNALVPDLSGGLQDSSKVSVDASDLVAAVSYDKPYAARVHESLTARHDDGQAKFLETALNAGRADLLEVIADRLRRQLGGK